MISKTRTPIMLGILLAFLAGCAQQPQTPPPPPDTRPQDEAAIRQASKEALAAVQAKDADKASSFYASDAVALFTDAPAISGKEQIKQAWATLFQDSNFSLSWAITKVEVAKSGELAYETGTYEETFSDARKKPVSYTGHYLVVLKKQSDGRWKIAYDFGHREPAAKR
jgi:uncharacterized protein (TIGR02246 family)